MIPDSAKLRSMRSTRDACLALLAGYANGEVRMIDLRRFKESAGASVPGNESIKTHSHGGLSVWTAHDVAPLWATGSTSSIVKVWNGNGDLVRQGVVLSIVSPVNQEVSI